MKHTIVTVMLAALAFACPADAHTGFFSGVIQPDGLHRCRFDLKGGELTKITLTGDGHGDVNCYLYEGDFKEDTARFVARDESPQDKCLFQFRPKQSSAYDLVISNVGAAPGRYVIELN